jgi:aminopeptidase N
VCWAAAWDMTRDGEMRARDYLSLVLSGAEFITDVSVLRTVLLQAASAVRRYADPAWRPEGLTRLGATLRDLLTGAAPGSDQQLTYARALAGVATGPDLEVLRGLLDGSLVIEGLAVDTDLRWALLQRLAARGAASDEQIDAELDADRTDAGERNALEARAGIPTRAAKALAWDEITGGGLPNAMFRAALDGFQDLDQPEVLAPFAGPYFEKLSGIWQDWGSDMAQYFAMHAYPETAVSAATIAETDAWLDRADPPAALRRLVTENRDDVARELRCRERDARGG